MHLNSLLLSLILTGTVQFVPAAAPSADSVVRESDALLKHLVSPDGPGVALLIARGDHVVLRTARGKANIELGVPLKPDQVFRIASITKIFTAATVMRLVDEGQISLDDRLFRFLPDFPNADSITIGELLNHTAGISDRPYDQQPGFNKLDHTASELVSAIGKRPLDFPPGSHWAYSNAGFILLGAVIEKITGRPWHETLRTQILEPLGLRHTGFDSNAVLIPGRVSGYTTDGPSHTVSNPPYFSPTMPLAAGDLESTVDDLMRWMRALTSGRVITKDSFQRMIAPSPDLPGTPTAYRYGFGIMLSEVRGVAAISHTGQIDGFASCVTYIPSSDITVVLLANDDNFDARTVARRFTAIALGKPYIEPVAIHLTEEQMQALAGRYRIDSNLIETLSVRNGKVWAQRGSHKIIPMQMTADNQLHLIPDELSYWMPVRDSAGKVIRLDYYEDGDGPPKSMPRL